MSSALPGSRRPGWRIGRVLGVPLYLSPTWLLLAVFISVTVAPVVSSFAPGLGVLGAYAAGLLLAVLLAISILLHELSHAVVAQRLGMPVHGITLHFLGGVTQVGEESRTPGREFLVAVVGPITSIAVGLAALLTEILLQPTGVPLLMLRGLAGINLFVGVFNLLPGLPLDGGRLLRAAVWRFTGDTNRGLLVAGLTGRAVAAVAILIPLYLVIASGASLTDLVIGAVVAVFLWQGAGAAVSVARWRSRLPELDAGTLARPCIAVPADLPLAETLARARQASAGGVVTIAEEKVAGVLSERAVAATDPATRLGLVAADVARSVGPGLVLEPHLSGMDLLNALQRTPATEYVVLADGEVHGVLVTADVERALKAAAG